MFLHRCGWEPSLPRPAGSLSSGWTVPAPFPWGPPAGRSQRVLRPGRARSTPESSIVSRESLASSRKSCFGRQAGGLKVKRRAQKWYSWHWERRDFCLVSPFDVPCACLECCLPEIPSSGFIYAVPKPL